jgi:hypothetical protein
MGISIIVTMFYVIMAIVMHQFIISVPPPLHDNRRVMLQTNVPPNIQKIPPKPKPHNPYIRIIKYKSRTFIITDSRGFYNNIRYKSIKWSDEYSGPLFDSYECIELLYRYTRRVTSVVLWKQPIDHLNIEAITETIQSSSVDLVNTRQLVKPAFKHDHEPFQCSLRTMIRVGADRLTIFQCVGIILNNYVPDNWVYNILLLHCIHNPKLSKDNPDIVESLAIEYGISIGLIASGKIDKVYNEKAMKEDAAAGYIMLMEEGQEPKYRLFREIKPPTFDMIEKNVEPFGKEFVIETESNVCVVVQALQTMANGDCFFYCLAFILNGYMGNPNSRQFQSKADELRRRLVEYTLNNGEDLIRRILHTNGNEVTKYYNGGYVLCQMSVFASVLFDIKLHVYTYEQGIRMHFEEQIKRPKNTFIENRYKEIQANKDIPAHAIIYGSAGNVVSDNLAQGATEGAGHFSVLVRTNREPTLDEIDKMGK